MSYKIHISIEPNWQEIIDWATKNSNEQNLGIAKNILRDKTSRGVYMCNQASFNFIDIFEEKTGLNLIWSDYTQEFLKEFGCWGYIFEPGNIDTFVNRNKYPIFLTRRISISPYAFCFDSEHDSFPPTFIPQENVVTKFPYLDIVNLFSEIDATFKVSSAHTPKVIVFPKRINDVLQEHNIAYEAFSNPASAEFNGGLQISDHPLQDGSTCRLLDVPVDVHYFKSPYYTISIQFQFFKQRLHSDTIPKWAQSII
jgi:hypothetical protein